MTAARITIAGRVVHGAGRGKPMGFPTANLDVTEPHLLPEDGVYLAWFRLAGWESPTAALLSVGTNPTFGPGGRTAEAYVLDVDENMYGSAAEVEIITMIRGQVRFESTAALVEQMLADEREGRRMLAEGLR
ncbi:riboflavin kinase [Actinoplanes sp. NPDC051494]|uniref:riboflavin kinase n=1 Tax=Actinoplanes sp. NPDC051494 TaxID=3363907 RepID=UPI003793082E